MDTFIGVFVDVILAITIRYTVRAFRIDIQRCKGMRQKYWRFYLLGYIGLMISLALLFILIHSISFDCLPLSWVIIIWSIILIPLPISAIFNLYGWIRNAQYLHKNQGSPLPNDYKDRIIKLYVCLGCGCLTIGSVVLGILKFVI